MSSLRPQSTRASKTGRGQLRADDPALFVIALYARDTSIRRVADRLGVSKSIVRRAVKLHPTEGATQ